MNRHDRQPNFGGEAGDNVEKREKETLKLERQ